LTTRYSPNSDHDDDLPAIAELLSGIKPNDVSASANSNSDDNDGFLDVDVFLAGLQQKSASTSAKPDSVSLTAKVDDGTRGGSPVYSSKLLGGSTQGEHTASLNSVRPFYSYDPRSNHTE
jgi:hypothetical protein